MQSRELITDYCENNTKLKNTRCGHNAEFLMLWQSARSLLCSECLVNLPPALRPVLYRYQAQCHVLPLWPEMKQTVIFWYPMQWNVTFISDKRHKIWAGLSHLWHGTTAAAVGKDKYSWPFMALLLSRSSRNYTQVCKFYRPLTITILSSVVWLHIM
jgi:hypothetical protein